MSLPRWRCRGSRCRHWTGANTPQPPASRAAPMCSPMLLAGNPESILIASGSELILAVEAHEQLLAESIRSSAVSMPSWDIFERQPQEYRDSVLPPSIDRPRCDRAGLHVWMGALCGMGGPRYWDENLRRVCPAQGAADEIRLRAGAHRGDREGVAGQGLILLRQSEDDDPTRTGQNGSNRCRKQNGAPD